MTVYNPDFSFFDDSYSSYIQPATSDYKSIKEQWKKAIDCLGFVFRFIQDMAIYEKDLYYLFAEDGVSFLEANGYQVVDLPQNGDLVVYGNYNGINEENIKHFGIWMNGKVISKWGDLYNFYEHDLHHTFPDYGPFALFFRKVQYV